MEKCGLCQRTEKEHDNTNRRFEGHAFQKIVYPVNVPKNIIITRSTTKLPPGVTQRMADILKKTPAEAVAVEEPDTSDLVTQEVIQEVPRPAIKQEAPLPVTEIVQPVEPIQQESVAPEADPPVTEVVVDESVVDEGWIEGVIVSYHPENRTGFLRDKRSRQRDGYYFEESDVVTHYDSLHIGTRCRFKIQERERDFMSAPQAVQIEIYRSFK